MSVHAFSVKGAEGEVVPLSRYAGKVLLVVNVASKCGFTPQYEALEALYRKYKDRGFEILAFPCNQFGSQEPGSFEEIGTFCKLTYDVTFRLLAKIDVNGEYADPIYTYLKRMKPGLLGSKAIKWNFTKFLVDRQGQVTARFAPMTKPSQLEDGIEELLS